MSDEAKVARKKVADPAIKALATCVDTINALEPAAQDRVMVWLDDVFGPVHEPAPGARE